MTSIAVNSVARTTSPPIFNTKLNSLKHFSQPIFLFKRNRELIETNMHGENALDKQWVCITNRRLHFNGHDNDAIVDAAIERLFTSQEPEALENSHCERIALQNMDMVYRTYTLSRESLSSQNILLTIQGDPSRMECNVQILTQAFGLSRCETKVMRMMVTGMKPKEIAYAAGISLNTVRSHLRTLYAKMQVRDYNDALTQAVRLLV